MIDFSNVQNVFIPEGEVAIIARGEEILWEKSKKPYSVELQYIESNGVQYIDTGVTLTTTTDFEFTGSITEGTKTGWIAGAPTWVGIHKKAETVAITQTSGGQTYLPVGIHEVFTIGLFGNKAYFNGVETNTLQRKNATSTLFLFAYHHTNGTGTINTAIRMRSFRIWDGGNIIRDFIPVLDRECVPCMYDKVGGELFYNQGTEEFLYTHP